MRFQTNLLAPKSPAIWVEQEVLVYVGTDVWILFHLSTGQLPSYDQM